MNNEQYVLNYFTHGNNVKFEPPTCRELIRIEVQKMSELNFTVNSTFLCIKIY